MLKRPQQKCDDRKNGSNYRRVLAEVKLAVATRRERLGRIFPKRHRTWEPGSISEFFQALAPKRQKEVREMRKIAPKEPRRINLQIRNVPYRLNGSPLRLENAS